MNTTMHSSFTLRHGLFLLGSWLAFASCHAASFDVRQPSLDSAGRFWLYGAATDGRLPFTGYGWIPQQASQMMTIDPDSRTSPHPEPADRGSGTCMEINVAWRAPNWCGVMFLSGPDDPPWWGEDLRGWYYDLRGLPKKRLVFFARGQTGNERIQVKLGAIGDKRYGDSLKFPAETPWLRLGTNWQQFTLDLSAYRPADLARICNGLTIVMSQAQQEGGAPTMRFWLDTIYLE